MDSAAVKAAFEYGGKTGGSAARFADLTFKTPDAENITITWPDPQPTLALRMCEAKLASSTYLASGKTNDAPVGSGPYTLDLSATTQGSVYTFVKNESHWDSANFPYKKLVLKVIDSDTAALNALKTGQVNGSIISTGTVKEAEASGLQVQTIKGGSTTRLLLTDHLGEKIPALGSIEVRQAMNMVFDRNAIATQLYQGNATPAYQIFREGSDAFIDNLQDPYPFDVEKAKSLMAAAGFADGFDLTIPTMSGQNHELLLPYITQQLALINIRVTEKKLSGPTAITDLLSGEYPVPVWELGNYGESLQDIADYVLADGIWNVEHQKDATVAELWGKVLTATSQEDKVALEKEINQYVVDQAWFVPMANPDRFYAYTTGVDVKPATDFAGLHPLLRDFK